MIYNALLAYAHYLALFLVIGTLCMEIMLYAPNLSLEKAKKLLRIDAVYGAAAALVLLSGFSRVFWYGKSSAFYFSNPVFWAKLSLFVLWALISLIPTFHYLKWMPGLKKGQAPEISPSQYRTVRRCLIAQIHLACLVPLLAVLMARGYGLPQ